MTRAKVSLTIKDDEGSTTTIRATVDAAYAYRVADDLTNEAVAFKHRNTLPVEPAEIVPPPEPKRDGSDP